MRLIDKTNQEIFNFFRELHKDKYSYDDVPIKIKSSTNLTIHCPQHGVFTQRADHHANGSRRPRCANSFYKTRESYIEELKAIHGDRFDYSKVEYTNSHGYVTLICKKHGEFTIRATIPIKRPGLICCLKCMNRKIFSHEDFICIAKDKHPLYDYSDTVYTRAKDPIEIICPIHGKFSVIPDSFLHAQCPCVRCRNGNRSGAEKKWLESLYIEGLEYQRLFRIEGKRYRADGFDPNTNTIYEFNGDYFHGNPKYFDDLWVNQVSGKCFGELYEKTKEREKAFRSAGYNVVSIWESDYYASLGRGYTFKPMSPMDKLVIRLNYLKSLDLADDEYLGNLDPFIGLYERKL